MKKLVPQTGGHPLRLNDAILLQNAVIDMAVALSSLANAGNDCVLQGCTVSGNNIGGGWIYFNGEIYQAIATVLPAPGGGQSLYWNIVQTTENPVTLSSPYTVEYQDLVFKGVHIKRTMVPAWGTSGSVANAALPRVTATMINGGLNPLGAVQMWAGNIGTSFSGTGLGLTSMSGWALCNGQNGTIDLRGRFVVGYDPAVIDYNAQGKIGGLSTVALVAAEMPIHTHTFTGSAATTAATNVNHTHDYLDTNNQNDTNRGTLQGGAADANESSITRTTNGANSSLNHTHTFTATGTIGAAGGGTAHENRPPYFTLAYIQRIS